MNSKMLQAVLKAHVVKGELRSNQISDGMMKPTLLDGYELMFFLKNSVARVNGANIVLTDMEASNGIIHVIDKVIIPPEVKVSKTQLLSCPTTVHKPKFSFALTIK